MDKLIREVNNFSEMLQSDVDEKEQNKTIRKMTITAVVKKLVGEINPVGETVTDNERFENLKVMTQLVENLLDKINIVAYKYRYSPEFSAVRASEFATEFLSNINAD